MKIFYSGGTGLTSVPESLIPERKPRIMLTFYDIRKSGTANRFKSFLRQKHENQTRRTDTTTRNGKTGNLRKGVH